MVEWFFLFIYQSAMPFHHQYLTRLYTDIGIILQTGGTPVSRYIGYVW